MITEIRNGYAPSEAQLEPWAAGKVSMYFSSEFLLEFVSQGISKGGAVRFLCGRLGISPEEAVAAGDAENDIPMLQAAGIGAAVANAAPEVKAAAGLDIGEGLRPQRGQSDPSPLSAVIKI